MEDSESGDLEEVHNVSKDSSWLKEPNEKLMDVKVEGDIDNERNEALCHS